ncbi:hypothetical protein [Oceanobacillus kapialis]|uniref:Uncharacterized protein n=1 Tax=Oceanobacillus kapialis TaxID=481353 RepID=A0ABW5PYA3_9BACI
MKKYIGMLGLGLLVVLGLGLGIPNNSVQASAVDATTAEIQSRQYIEVRRTFSLAQYENAPPSYIRYNDGRLGGTLYREDYILNASTGMWTAWYAGYVSSSFPTD